MLQLHVIFTFDVTFMQEKKKKSAEELTQMQEGMKKLQDRMVEVSL
jgi:hypothetical protein